MRFFNTAGPVVPEMHYCVPPLGRLDADEFLLLIRQWKYFVLHRGVERTLREGLEQTRAYMDRCGVAEGHLVVFDRTEGRSWDEKLYRREEAEGGAPVTVWGM